jgi:hypothetical protein
MKDFTLYPEALELKQLGFDEPCFGLYFLDGQKFKHQFAPIPNNGSFKDSPFKEVSAPTYSQAFRWFREKYGLCRHIKPENNEDDLIVWEYVILTISDSEVVFTVRESNHTLHEEAELACLRKLIEIVKEKQNGRSS